MPFTEVKEQPKDTSTWKGERDSGSSPARLQVLDFSRLDLGISPITDIAAPDPEFTAAGQPSTEWTEVTPDD